MKKFLNRKILFIFSLFLFFILINNNSVHASSVLVTSDTYNKAFIDSYIDAGQSPLDALKKIVDHYNEVSPGTLQFTSEDLPPYYVLIEPFNSGGSSDGYTFFFSEYPLFYRKGNYANTDYYFVYTFPENEDGTIPETQKTYGVHRINEGGFTFGDTVIGETSGGTLSGYSYNGYKSAFIASNYDIVDQADTSSVVFQQPTLGKATTLAPVIQREKTKGTLQVVLTEIIQILPLIIVVLVSFLGLRKALKMLSRLLNRS